MPNERNSSTADRELVIDRLLNAPVALVWEAWSRPEHISHWWGPKGFTTTMHLMEFRPGGRWEFILHGPDGTDYDNKSVFLEIVPARKIVYEHTSWPHIIATIEFLDKGESTSLRWHMLFDSPEELTKVAQMHKAAEGLKQNMERLIAYLPTIEPVSGSAAVNGIKMYYERHGKGGVPLVLLHGGGSTIESSFSQLLPLFARQGEVIAVELQAHGRTTDRPEPESFEQDADDVAALLRHLHIPKANLFGFSNGGTTVLQLAIRHPELVNKLVSLSGAYQREGFVPGFFEGFPGATLESMPEPLRSAFLKVTPDQQRLQTMFEKDVARMMNFTDVKEETLRKIQAPALLMSSDKDVIIPEHTMKMARVIPRGQLVILPGVHGECIGEVAADRPGNPFPGITASLVGEFLRG
ncbi:alpha/beta fold hydrolase [Puia sp.]|uniref:alpha/beta fold hydrolase n=1 Tax=Puia sp. TaxID=2045100 RepID=UPI002F3F623D